MNKQKLKTALQTRNEDKALDRRLIAASFVRGIFFGVGSLLGGTIVLAILVWVLNLFTGIPGEIGEFFQDTINNLQR